MRTAVELAAGFHAVADDPHAAKIAARCDGVDRAFEAVEYVRLTRLDQLEGLVIVIAADLAFHGAHPVWLTWAIDTARACDRSVGQRVRVASGVSRRSRSQGSGRRSRK